jgi:tetratricopeptide (TPR) repeat protein
MTIRDDFPDDMDDSEEPQLPDHIHEQIVALSEKANAALDSDEPQSAIEPLQQALDLLPPTQSDWEAWTWLNATLGDAYVEMKECKLAKISLYDAMSGPDGMTNPFILLRLGQCLFELGDTAKAREMLAHAHMLEGDELFAEEPHKYLAFLKSPAQ